MHKGHEPLESCKLVNPILHSGILQFSLAFYESSERFYSGMGLVPKLIKGRRCRTKQFKYCPNFSWLRRNKLLSWRRRFGTAARRDYRSYKSFFAVFFLFLSWEYSVTKHLMTCPSGSSEFCFPKTHCFPWGQSLSAY